MGAYLLEIDIVITPLNSFAQLMQQLYDAKVDIMF